MTAVSQSFQVTLWQTGETSRKCNAQEHQAVQDFCSPFDILDFTSKDAENFGLIRAFLEKIGKPIGSYDIEIAAQAITRNLIVVTNNTSEFTRIPKLRVENWIE